ncbi:uncharacterized protein K02A2.6-like [Nasonia vitripennis]|uniref:Reverse transcriptase domain-containing protein n=1 Tax=Nasonia vitripennis TaxID=7425 RepID=A0A7M7Q5W8_NASVI|nr:uncharacterized protein K02A2.6-like [Nasonia vitripennis]
MGGDQATRRGSSAMLEPENALAESAFQSNRIIKDSSRYNLLVSNLPPEVAQEVSDIILAPPAEHRYETLKAAVISRLAASADQQLHQLLNEVQLGDRTPSQLLRYMRRLAGNAISDEALRIRWLDLLPSQASRMCRVLRTSTLDELATLADELVAPTPSVSAVSRPSSPASSGIVSGTTTPLPQHEIVSLRLVMSQISATLQQQSLVLQSILTALATKQQQQQQQPQTQRRSRSRTPIVHRKPSMVLVSSEIRKRGNAVQASMLLPDAGKLLAPPPPQAAAVGANDEQRLHVLDRSSGLRFLVDTGSAVSLLPRNFLKRTLQRGPLKLSAANATSIDTYGAHHMDVDLRLHRPLSWKFIVADVSNPILGADFLAHYGLVVDVKRKRILDTDTSRHATCSLKSPEIHSVEVCISADVAEGIFADLMRQYSDLATPGSTTIALPDLDAQHHITTTGPPAAAKARRLLGPRLEAALAEFKVLLEMGIVRLSDSSWASPLRLVLKPDGTYRITGDYRQLNSRTVPDRYPLPIIEDLLLALGGTIFSVVDLKKAFYQLPIAPEDAHKTAIITPFGLFEFTRSSLGLRNAAQSLQRAMDQLLRDLPFARAYLDDIIVASNNEEEHVGHLRTLFDVLRAANIKVNPEKCVLGKKQVTYLGYLVSAEGSRPPQDRIDAIQAFPKPGNSAQLRRLLGLINYYRR